MIPSIDATFDVMYTVLKKECKVNGITYRDLAKVLNATPNSVKLRFSNQSLSIKQLFAIADMIGLTLSDLMRKVEQPAITKFIKEQEDALVQDMRLLLVWRRIIDDWSVSDIVATYKLRESEVIKCLLELEQLGVIELLPNNVVRKLVGRGAEWLQDGPLHNLLLSRIDNFLKANFREDQSEYIFFASGSLTRTAMAVLRSDMRRLKTRFETLHEECKLLAAHEQRYNVTLLAAARRWELPDFLEMMRDPTETSTTKAQGKTVE